MFIQVLKVVMEKVKKNKIPKNLSIPKAQQLAFVALKVWGHEEWIVNNEKYCGKKLVLRRGWRCSLHFHKIKDETFYLLSGKIFLETVYQGKKNKRIMTPGDIVHIPVGMVHRFTGIEDAEIIEFSTRHREEDSYRIEVSGKADLRLLSIE